jgi:histone demethylase JARID1
MLEGPITPKALDELLQKFVDFSVNVPELRVLRQYKNDYTSWISRFNAVVESANTCENQELIVNELTSIKKDGSLLKIQADELSLLEVELTKASCKVKALKLIQGLGCKMPIDFIGQVLSDAKRLKIEDDNIYKELSQKFRIARIWEERAENLLSNGDQLNKFEDMIRYSEDIFAILPSLEDIKEAVSSAKSWLNESKPFLVSDSPVEPFSNSLLKVDDLKDLVKRSKLLKIHMEERCTLEKVLYDCMKWENIACHVLSKVEVLLNSVEISDNLICEIERQIVEVKSNTKGGLALHFDFLVLPKLGDGCSTLQWCFKVLSLRAVSPSLEEVNMLLEVYNQLPRSYASSALTSSLIVGVNWLKKALEINLPCERRLFKLSEAEDVLEQYKAIRISFPVIVDRLQVSIKRHNSWVKQVEQFFSLKSCDRSRSLLWELQELGSTDAFNCSELDKILFEARKVMLWRKQFSNICGAGDGDETELFNSLDKIKSNLDKSLDLYKKLKQSKQGSVCICCYSDINQEALSTCSVCQDCYHLRCIGPVKDNLNGARIHICPCCSLMDSGKNFRNKFMGKHPQLNSFVKLSSDADDLCVLIEDTYMTDTIIAKALESKSCLMEVVNFALAYSDKDIDVVTRKLYIALKAVEVGGVYDHDSNSKLEQVLLRYSWRFRIRKLLQSSQKTSIQQIDRHLKEGVAIGIPPEDHFRVKLMELRTDGLQWADRAKKVSADSGELDLDSVFDLIAEGENLAVHFDKELKSLKDRSMLYCICRKPYDDRAMIACDKCDEWYHFDCINLVSPPKIYICPACNFDDFIPCPSTTQERLSGKCGEPQTPSPCRLKKVKKKKKKCAKRKAPEEANEVATGRLFWRNQKPFRRAVRKRVELEILSPFYYVQ